ncbi:putative ammonium transporter 3 [Halotydeus destructor]|nr:putative ammonium transporter 3 [Halotydeus destructor]
MSTPSVTNVTGVTNETSGHGHHHRAESSDNNPNDVIWILTSAFLTFTMQTGYSLLESGVVSRKNEVNILIKNAINVMFGGFAFWMFGYALSYGEPSNAYFGYGNFFIVANETEMGAKYSELMFQLAYSTTATSIVSGSVSERMSFGAYSLFSLLNTFVYCLPARWLLRKGGWLQVLGAVDIGGSGTVHLVGGCSGLVAAILLGPRIGRFDSGLKRIPMGNPTNAMQGLFMLWWGWLGFSAGSTFGITGDKWKYSSSASVTTILATIGAGCVGMSLSVILRKGLQDITILVDAILASLVAVSGGAPILRPSSAIVTGMMAACLVLIAIRAVNWLKIDDPTNSFAVHGVGGAWGLLAIGLLAEKDTMINYTSDLDGLLISGDPSLLTFQLIACASLIAWSCFTSFVLLLLLKLTIGIRVSLAEELLGPDLVDHGLIHEGNVQVIDLLSRKKLDISKWVA